MYNGFTTEKSVKQNILYYLRNSKIEHFSSGSYGITKKSILDDSICQQTKFQPFLSLDANIEVFKTKRSKNFTRVEQYKIPIKTLMIKICVINKDDEPFPNKLPKKSYHTNNPNYDEKSDVKSKYIRLVDESEFNLEVNIQTDVYLKTMKYLQPMCPAILYSTIITDTRQINVEQKQHEDEIEMQEILELLGLPKFITNKNVSYGLIFMEFLEGYSTFEKFKIPSNKSKKSFVLMLLWALIQLTLETGYVHGDHHLNNIMINNNYPKGGYFAYSTTRIMIIDFGMSSKLLPTHYKTFKALCKRHKYTDALMFLGGKYKNKQGNIIYVTNENVADYVNYKNIYGWAYGSYNGKLEEKDHINDLFKEYHVQTTNDTINNLFALREIALNKNINTANMLHGLNPLYYPLLPLSNRIKKYLYSGLDDVTKIDEKIIKKMRIYAENYELNKYFSKTTTQQTNEETITDDDSKTVSTFLDWNFAALS